MSSWVVIEDINESVCVCVCVCLKSRFKFSGCPYFGVHVDPNPIYEN